MTLAAVDRLVHHVTIFEMNVESFRRLECAPAGGQFRRFELTLPVGLPEDGSHDEASIAQRRVQAAGC